MGRREERGQIFTLDMFLALAITALMVSYSGLAYEQAHVQAKEYALRHSLERVANDAADVLVKTLGKPDNWYKQAENLCVLGFAEENEDEGKPIPGTVSVIKFGQFRRLLSADNWDATVNENAITAIKKHFGGSEKFEVRILDDNDNELWHAFPRWDVENSPIENSTEVVVVRRLVAVRYGSAIRADTGMVVHAVGGETDENLEFNIYPGELDAFDWYIIVRGGGNGGAPWPNLKIFVNRPTQGAGNPDYQFKKADIPERTYPSEHGGIEEDEDVDNQLVEGSNYLGLKFTSGPGWWVRVYVVSIPHCSDWGMASSFLQPLPATLEVKMWR